ncbi:23571_t:CDS:1, partial [Gigaspora rosea]
RKKVDLLDSLNRFKQETQRIIIQWFKSAKGNHNKNDEDDYYRNQILLSV